MTEIANATMKRLTNTLANYRSEPEGTFKAVKASKSTADDIDLLGLVKAEKAKLEKLEELLKSKLIDKKVTEQEGDFYRVTVSVTSTGRLDMDAVRAKLTPQFISKNTKTTDSTVVRVSARTGNTTVAAAA